MALGFGFNKTKVLSSAERYIQQGKLRNAISEYEKVIKADPKDLTVLNTIGDLYARLGQTDQAVSYFKTVGDSYANQGFTVKAIAMYKKLTKIKANVESILKLAELYGQQGLYNDARAQYASVAEQFLRAGQLEQAIRLFQKILEIDPENTGMQIRMAEVYVRLERKDEARKILLKTVEALHARGAKKEVEQILQRLMDLDPNDRQTLMLRGRMAVQGGDFATTIQVLESNPDLDGNAEGLRSLGRAYLMADRVRDAGPIAKKLCALYQDSSGLTAYVDALLKAGDYDEALRVYNEYSDKLLGDASTAPLENLHACIDHIRHNVSALNQLRQLYEKVGDKEHLIEVADLLAQACIESGDKVRAREIYLQLAALDPDNSAYAQSYNLLVQEQKQEDSKSDGTSKSASEGEGRGPLVIEDLNNTAPEIEQSYDEELESEIRNVLTDSDLLSSYSMPAKAIAPLAELLPRAPRDARINRHLAALYARAERFSEAAQCCETLRSVYLEAGHAEQALGYGELAERFLESSGTGQLPAVAEPKPKPAAVANDEAPMREIDLSREWESAFSAPVTADMETASQHTGDAERATLVEEIRFYLQHALWDEARTAIGKCEAQFPDTSELASFRAQLQSGSKRKGAIEAPAPAMATEKPAPQSRAKEPAPAAAGKGALTDVVLDLEETLGNTLGNVPPAPVPAQPARMAAAASGDGRQATMSATATATTSAPASTRGAIGHATAEMGLSQTDSELADIFSEFKEGLADEGRGPTEGEDPETHYNLGVAFKEMGLLDEAIGELQKVCQAVEQGHSFPQVMQAYTWLAQCFLEKGVPQASVRWYEKALNIPAIDNEARVALHYELAAAYEAADNKQAALNHFMEVYGSNIDYRDVAERIKSLKS